MNCLLKNLYQMQKQEKTLIRLATNAGRKTIHCGYKKLRKGGAENGYEQCK